ncbi:MAG TPA: serine hydrolase [Burkholderiaceae bacterium]
MLNNPLPTPQATRRLALQLAATSLAAPVFQGCAASQADSGEAPAAVQQAVARFVALSPATSGVLVQSYSSAGGWKAAYQPDTQLFVGSAVKTFILAQFLRDVETGYGGASENAQCTISDTVRSPGSAVFAGLNGQTPYRSALEAMITHSDNTATDIALGQVGPERVRGLISEAGLTQTRIPDSTRKLFSYLAGAPSGTDLGWQGMLALDRGDPSGLTARKDVINEHQSMLSSASEMVRWYHTSLSGKFFQKTQTLTEYKRIHAMADAIWLAIPPDVHAFGKGGSIDWEGFHCLSFPGQMLVGDIPVGFSFILNWTDGASSVERTQEFIGAAADVLNKAIEALKH